MEREDQHQAAHAASMGATRQGSEEGHGAKDAVATARVSDSGAHGGAWAQGAAEAEEAQVQEAHGNLYVQIMHRPVCIHRRTRQWRRRQEELRKRAPHKRDICASTGAGRASARTAARAPASTGARRASAGTVVRASASTGARRVSARTAAQATACMGTGRIGARTAPPGGQGACEAARHEQKA